MKTYLAIICNLYSSCAKLSFCLLMWLASLFCEKKSILVTETAHFPAFCSQGSHTFETGEIQGYFQVFKGHFFRFQGPFFFIFKDENRGRNCSCNFCPVRSSTLQPSLVGAPISRLRIKTGVDAIQVGPCG